MTREPKVLRDGMLSCLGGADSGRSPSLIGDQQVSFAVNAAMRGGYAATRPRVSKKTLAFATTEIQDWFEDNILQGYEVYYALNGVTSIVESIGGRIFSITPGARFDVQELTPTANTNTTADFTVPAVDSTVDMTVTDGSRIFVGYPVYIGSKLYVVTARNGNVITIQNKTDTAAATVTTGALVVYLDPNTPNLPTAWLTQAEQYLLIQNGVDACIIFDGAGSRRAGANEVPTGTAMVFNEEIGRLCVAVAGNEIAVGDVTGGPTPVTSFTETQYLAEGGKFKIPNKFGKILAMAMMANLDRANGQGPWWVSAERGITTFNLPPNRLQWKALTYVPQLNMPLPSATSQESVALVNGDIYYRAKDGLRSFTYAIREFLATSGNTPISSELNRVTKYDDDRLLRRASAMRFDNRLIFTVNPAPSRNGTYHKALASLDFDLVSRIGQKAPPTYDCIWTGLKATGMVSGNFSGKDRAFIFALNKDTNANELWELHKESGFDNADSRVETIVETRSFTFKSPTELKRLEACEIWVDNVIGTVNFELQWRPDQSPCWYDWEDKEICVAFQDCEQEECKPLMTYNPGYRTRLVFGAPPEQPDCLDCKRAEDGFEFQLRLTWTGHCRVRKILAKARIAEEQPYPVDVPD